MVVGCVGFSLFSCGLGCFCFLGCVVWLFSCELLGCVTSQHGVMLCFADCGCGSMLKVLSCGYYV